MATDSEIRADLQEMRNRLDQLLSNSIRTQTILEQKFIPEQAEMKATLVVHESLRQRFIGIVLFVGALGGAIGGKIAYALGLFGGNHPKS